MEAVGRILHISCVKVESDPDVDSRRVALNGVVFTVNASVAKFLRIRVVCTSVNSEIPSHLAAFVVSVPFQSFMAFQIGSSIPADVHSCDSTERKPSAEREPSQGWRSSLFSRLTLSLKARQLQNRAK